MVVDEGSDAMEVVGVERNGTAFIFGWDQWAILDAEAKPPKLGARGFAPPFEEDGIFWAIDCDGYLEKNHDVVV